MITPVKSMVVVSLGSESAVIVKHKTAVPAISQPENTEPIVPAEEECVILAPDQQGLPIPAQKTPVLQGVEPSSLLVPQHRLPSIQPSLPENEIIVAKQVFEIEAGEDSSSFIVPEKEPCVTLMPVFETPPIPMACDHGGGGDCTCEWSEIQW